MPTRVQIENNLDNARRYFANKMDKLVDKGLELNPEEISFENAVNNLFYVIEANEFMLKNNIATDDKTFLSVYKKMMCIIGVYANNLTKDNSLIIIGA